MPAISTRFRNLRRQIGGAPYRTGVARSNPMLATCGRRASISPGHHRYLPDRTVDLEGGATCGATRLPTSMRHTSSARGKNHLAAMRSWRCMIRLQATGDHMLFAYDRAGAPGAGVLDRQRMRAIFGIIPASSCSLVEDVSRCVPSLSVVRSILSGGCCELSRGRPGRNERAGDAGNVAR